VFAARGYTLCDTAYADANTELRLMARASIYCPTTTAEIAGLATFDGRRLALAGIETQQHNGVLTVQTGWRLADVAASDPYTVAFHLLDDTGDLIAQADVGLAGADGPYTPVEGQIIMSELPAQTFTLHVFVYNWQTGARLDGTPYQMAIIP
ncbi:MAG: hypothetical protein AAF125_17495, partial [Chloroflexota bacterium]